MWGVVNMYIIYFHNIYLWNRVKQNSVGPHFKYDYFGGHSLKSLETLGRIRFRHKTPPIWPKHLQKRGIPLLRACVKYVDPEVHGDDGVCFHTQQRRSVSWWFLGDTRQRVARWKHSHIILQGLFYQHVRRPALVSVVRQCPCLCACVFISYWMAAGLILL